MVDKTFDDALLEKDIHLDEDSKLPRGSRTQQNVSRIIQAVRATESCYNSEINRLNRATQALIAENQRLKGQLMKYQLENKLEGYEQLSIADRQDIMSVPEKLVAIEN